MLVLWFLRCSSKVHLQSLGYRVLNNITGGKTLSLGWSFSRPFLLTEEKIRLEHHFYILCPLSSASPNSCSKTMYRAPWKHGRVWLPNILRKPSGQLVNYRLAVVAFVEIMSQLIRHPLSDIPNLIIWQVCQ